MILRENGREGFDFEPQDRPDADETARRWKSGRRDEERAEVLGPCEALLQF
jgi:hypothetical protein